MPPIVVDSPLAAAANSAAAFFSGQQDAKKAKAEAERQARDEASKAALQQHQMQLADQAAKLNADKFTYQQGEDTKQDAFAQAAALLNAKKEAANEIHQAAVDALDKSKQLETVNKNANEHHDRILTVTQKANEAAASLKNARTLEAVRSATQFGIAKIHEAGANSRHADTEANADSRQTRGEAFSQAQQARGFAHADTAAKTRATKATKTPPLQDRRGADYAQGMAVLKKAKDANDPQYAAKKTEVVRRYMATYGLSQDKADELFADQ